MKSLHQNMKMIEVSLTSENTELRITDSISHSILGQMESNNYVVTFV